MFTAFYLENLARKEYHQDCFGEAEK